MDNLSFLVAKLNREEQIILALSALKHQMELYEAKYLIELPSLDPLSERNTLMVELHNAPRSRALEIQDRLSTLANSEVSDAIRRAACTRVRAAYAPVATASVKLLKTAESILGEYLNQAINDEDILFKEWGFAEPFESTPVSKVLRAFLGRVTVDSNPPLVGQIPHLTDHVPSPNESAAIRMVTTGH